MIGKPVTETMSAIGSVQGVLCRGIGSHLPGGRNEGFVCDNTARGNPRLFLVFPRIDKPLTPESFGSLQLPAGLNTSSGLHYFLQL